MKNLLNFALFFSIVLNQKSEGLKCWTCENSNSVKQCDQTGYLKECNPSQDVCGIEVRHNGVWQVLKYCKQKKACGNVQNQNAMRAWVISQCNPKSPHSVCRCCCQEDGCNKGEMKCVKDLEMLPGCSPPHNAPVNGKVFCTNGTLVNSLCAFFCDKGYYVDGQFISVCGEGQQWTEPAPVCTPIKCPDLPDFKNGIRKCTNDAVYGSLCRFSCDSGYRLIGPESTLCDEDVPLAKIGKWTTSQQICERKRCKGNLGAPEYGKIYCTEYDSRVSMESVCRFSCYEEFYLVGNEYVKCVFGTMDETPFWDGPAPVCKRKHCEYLPMYPTNGYVICNNGRFINSVCEFVCDKGYFLSGANETACVPDVAYGEYVAGNEMHWTKPAPTCERKHCVFAMTAPDRGKVSCTDSKYLSSVCTFACDYTHRLVGYVTTHCAERTGYYPPRWTRKAPVCKPKRCGYPPRIPDYGFVTCYDRDFLGSACLFSCDKRFYIKGAPYATCVEKQAGGKLFWDGDTPQCIRKECDALPLAPANGQIECSEMSFLGSVCSFSCDVGFTLEGTKQTICIEDKKPNKVVWEGYYVSCKRKECDPITSLQNARVACDDQNFIGSNCEFSCDKFSRRVGPLRTTCLEDRDGNAAWSRQAAVCERITCPKIKEMKHVSIECSDGENVDSECQFSCTVTGYELSPSTRKAITCRNDSSWSAARPCCASSCPPFAVMDLIVVLDSSSSIGNDSWQIMLRFVNNIFDLFAVQPNATNFGVVRYNGEIDMENRIDLNDFPDDVNMLKDLVSNISYNGQGTRTGQALTYVNENMLLPEVGNRDVAPDVVFVITDGRSHDDVIDPAEALRANGALTFALGIEPSNGRLDLEQLEAIAGSPKRLFLAKEGFGKLTPQFAAEISDNICGDPCKRPVY